MHIYCVYIYCIYIYIQSPQKTAEKNKNIVISQQLNWSLWHQHEGVASEPEKHIARVKLHGPRPGKHTKSYWKWPLIVDFPMKNAGSFHSYVSHYQRVDGVDGLPAYLLRILMELMSMSITIHGRMTIPQYGYYRLYSPTLHKHCPKNIRETHGPMVTELNESRHAESIHAAAAHQERRIESSGAVSQSASAQTPGCLQLCWDHLRPMSEP